MKTNVWTKREGDRCSFIGGSDARIIMGEDEAAVLRLWREKRGELEPEDLSGNLLVQLVVTQEYFIGMIHQFTNAVIHVMGGRLCTESASLAIE